MRKFNSSSATATKCVGQLPTTGRILKNFKTKPQQKMQGQPQ